MVLVVEPLSVPPFQGCFEGEIEEIMVCSNLEADSTNYLAHSGTWLVFQEEVILEKGEMRRNLEINFT
jgi:hypothetical protein